MPHNIKVGDKVNYVHWDNFVAEVIGIGKELAIITSPLSGEVSVFTHNLIHFPKIEREYWANAYDSGWFGQSANSLKTAIYNRTAGANGIQDGYTLHIYQTSDGKWHIEEVKVDQT